MKETLDSYHETSNFLKNMCATIIGTPSFNILFFFCVNTWHGIWDHSFIQNLSRSFRFPGRRFWTLLFSSSYRVSVGFRLGDCDGHGKTFILQSVNHFCVDFELCFGSLCCWKVQPWPILSFLAEAVRFSFNICRYSDPKTLQFSGCDPLRFFCQSTHPPHGAWGQCTHTSSGWFLKSPVALNFLIIALIVEMGIFNCLEIFLYLFPDLCSSTTVRGTSSLCSRVCPIVMNDCVNLTCVTSYLYPSETGSHGWPLKSS